MDHGAHQILCVFASFTDSLNRVCNALPPIHLTMPWKVGSSEVTAFFRRSRLLNRPNYLDETPKARQLTSLGDKQVIANVAVYFSVSPSSYQSKRSAVAGRDLAAYLAHRHTTATLRELAPAFGLSHPDSVSNLIRRAQTAISNSRTKKLELERIEKLLHKQ